MRTKIFICLLLASCFARATGYQCPTGTLQNPNPKPLVMYSAKWCRSCKVAREFLQENKIPFEEYDIESTQKGWEDNQELNVNGIIPFFVMGYWHLHGYKLEKLARFYQHGICLETRRQ